MVKNYINLTNGIEAISQYDLKDYSFIRIQSTICEQKLWDKLILDLDYDFLMNLAIGNTCVVYDYGANRAIPRAVYQGLQFIKYVLYRFWYGYEITSCVNRKKNSESGINVTSYFRDVYKNLSNAVYNKLKYFTPFLSYNGINIKAVTDATVHDSDKEYYANIIAGISAEGEDYYACEVSKSA